MTSFRNPPSSSPPAGHPDFYRSTHKVDYVEPAATGYTSITCLLFLVGRVWDDLALAYVHALRPSCIRVTTGEEKNDAVPWRVTVHVNKTNRIQSIEQEVEVGLPDGIENGHHLDLVLRKKAKRGVAPPTTASVIGIVR